MPWLFRKTHTIILHNYIYKKLIIWAHDRTKTLVKHGPELSRRLLHPNFYTAGGRLDVNRTVAELTINLESYIISIIK